MDSTLWVSLLFGCIGMGMFVYGKKTSHFVPLGAGLALMVVPYFLANMILLLAVCTGLTLLPLAVRE